MSDTPVNVNDAAEARLGVNDLKIGSLVGEHYRVKALLGRGGMGVVYRVEQVHLGKEMALKTILPEFASPGIFSRFEHEARAAAAVDHANVVKVHDIGLLGDETPYMVMDLVAGETLAELLKKKVTLGVEEAIAVFTQVCLGLAAAHARGVVHRDIKPSNIMLVNDAPLGTEGSVKIVDFGIARLAQCEGGPIQALTQTGEIFGSPLYMSPEQCRGAAVDQRADVYSLGCVLFEALTGTTPFIGENALATMMQHQSATAPRLREASLGKDFPPALESILSKMLAKAPEDRYGDLSLLASDLGAVLHRPGATMREPARAGKKSKAAGSSGDSVSLSVTLALLALTAGIFLLVGFFISIRVTSPTAVPVAVPREKAVGGTRQTSTISDLVEEMSSGSSLRTALTRPLDNGLFKVKGLVLDDNAMKAIAEKPGISDLEFEYCTFEDSALRELRKLGVNLKMLSVRGCTFGDAGASEVANWTNLRHFKAERTGITDEGIIRIARLKHLTKVEIPRTSVARAGLKALAHLPTITSLSLDHCGNFSDDDLQPFVSSTVEDLDLQDVNIGDQAMKYLSKMPNLKFVRLEGTKVTRDGLLELLKNKHVEAVGVPRGPHLTEKQMMKIRRQFPSIQFGHDNDID